MVFNYLDDKRIDVIGYPYISDEKDRKKAREGDLLGGYNLI